MFSKIQIVRIGFLVLALSMVICTNRIVRDLQGESGMTEKTIQEVLKEHAAELMSIPGVVGAAQGLCDGKPCIKVFVIKKTPELQQKIPGTVEGYPVRIEATGEIRALPEDGD